MPAGSDRREDYFGQRLELNDRVLFAFNGKLAEGVVKDLHTLSALPMVTLMSLDGTESTKVFETNVCKISEAE